MDRIDKTVVAGVPFLIAFTALALGATHLWSFATMEAVAFALAILWIAKLWLRHLEPPRFFATDLAPIIIPLGLFAVLTVCQLVPLPPTFERIVSPATYRLFTAALPGWPAKSPYQAPPFAAAAEHLSAHRLASPTGAHLGAGAGAPLVERSGAAAGPGGGQASKRVEPLAADLGRSTWRWRPLSIAPSSSRVAFLKLAAYATVFLLVLLYPFGRPASERESEQRFSRIVLRTVVLVGMTLAAIGIYGRASENSLVLAIFKPYDWGTTLPWGERATGTFANPDHFANYLSLALPACLAGALFPRSFVSIGASDAYRLLCGLATVFIVAALVASGSRGGWASATIGVLSLAYLLNAGRRSDPVRAARFQPWTWLLALVGALAVAGFIVAGSQGREQAGARLRDSFAQGNLLDRLIPARNSIRMIGDFPLLGVGLGCWPELYRRYRPPPWSAGFANATHNDYAQLLAETGILGFGLIGLAFLGALRRLSQGFGSLSPQALPAFAALVAPLPGMAFHEFFDFPLQIPANVLLFTVLIALALRMAHTPGRLPVTVLAYSGPQRVGLGLGAALAVALMCAVPWQERGIPYPYAIRLGAPPDEVLALVRSHPADSRAHLLLAFGSRDRLPLERELQELRIALFLEPTHPVARDLYAQDLALEGNNAGVLDEISKSVFYSPSLQTHQYLDSRVIPLLPERERKAIEKGFEMAMARNFNGAALGLARFYEMLGSPAKAAQVYSRTANNDRDPRMRSQHLTQAGLDYARAGDLARGEAALRSAIAQEPGYAEPYQYLLTEVMGRGKDVAAARKLVSQGIAAGADPFALYVSLAQAAQRADNSAEAEAALERALQLQPSDFDAARQLGWVYLVDHKFDRAIFWLRQAAEIKPKSAQAFYELGVAEETAYQYFAADKAFVRAMELAPGNMDFRAHYRDFQRKLASSVEGSRRSGAPAPPGLSQ